MPRVLKKADSVKERKGKRQADDEIMEDEEPHSKSSKIDTNGNGGDVSLADETISKPNSTLKRNGSARKKAPSKEASEGPKKKPLGRITSARVAKETRNVVESEEEEPTVVNKPVAKKSSSKLNKSEIVKASKSKNGQASTLNKSLPVTGKTAKVLAARQKVTKESLVAIDESSEEEELADTTVKKVADTNNNKRGKDKMASSAKQRKICMKPVHDRGTGNVYCFGMGDFGQIGLGESVSKRKYPSLVEEIRTLKIIQVAAGGIHTVVLDDTGKVWTFGCNDDKALGRITEEEEEAFHPGSVELSHKIVQVSAGDSHSAVLTEEGDVYAWGTFKDTNGSFGLVPGDGELCRVKPEFISSNIPSKITKIGSGDHHLVMLSEEGRIYTCGTGEQGQLGRVYEDLDKTRVTRAHSSTANLSKNDFLLTPTEVKVLRKKFQDIWTGSFSTYALTKTNQVFVFGLNNYCQLGIKDQTVNVVPRPIKSPGFAGKTWKQISGGQHHAVALDEAGKVYTLGRSTDGRLGLGKDDGKDDGDDSPKSEPTAVPALNDLTCVQVAAGLSTAYALTNDGVLYSWGFGENFQLGTGTLEHPDANSLYPKRLEHMVLNKIKVNAQGKIIFVSGGGLHVALTISGVEGIPMEVDK